MILTLIINHAILNTSEIALFVSCTEGPMVASKAQKKLRTRIKPNCIQGKMKKRGICVKSTYYSTIVNPTTVPMSTPSRQEAKTKINAS